MRVVYACSVPIRFQVFLKKIEFLRCSIGSNANYIEYKLHQAPTLLAPFFVKIMDFDYSVVVFFYWRLNSIIIDVYYWGN